MVIKINPLSNYTNLEKEINRATNYLKSIEERIQKFIQKLAEVGYETADTIISEAVMENLTHAYNISANVKLEPIENGYSIVAYGSQIFFIEFGTGVEANHPYGQDFGMVEGSYSETHARKYVENGYWYYNGEKLVGTTAYMPMFYATNEMLEKMYDIAKEVFSE